MALPRRERRLAERIDREVTSTDPRLARLFRMFGRLCEGESLPDREQVRGGFWLSLRDALHAGAWLLAADPVFVSLAGEAGNGIRPIDALPGRPGQGPGQPGRGRRDGH